MRKPHDLAAILESTLEHMNVMHITVHGAILSEKATRSGGHFRKLCGAHVRPVQRGPQPGTQTEQAIGLNPSQLYKQIKIYSLSFLNLWRQS